MNGAQKERLEVTLGSWSCKGGSGGPREGPSATAQEPPRRGPELESEGSPRSVETPGVGRKGQELSPGQAWE